MSILIKGMEMPKDGELLCINIHPDGKVCINLDLECEKVGEAVPVPAHGRLGDLDELERDFREDAKGPWNMRAMPMNWADAFEEVADIVADAPTIISAEPPKEEA